MSASPGQNRRFVLANRPEELPEPGNFRIETAEIPQPGEGEVLVRVRYAALSPWQGQRLKDFIGSQGCRNLVYRWEAP